MKSHIEGPHVRLFDGRGSCYHSHNNINKESICYKKYDPATILIAILEELNNLMNECTSTMVSKLVVLAIVNTLISDS
jgi:hypothetical protein